MRRKTHQTIRKVTEDIQDRLHFNTAVAAIMELINTLYQFAVEEVQDRPTQHALREAAEATTMLLSPFTPHSPKSCGSSLAMTTAFCASRGPSMSRC